MELVNWQIKSREEIFEIFKAEYLRIAKSLGVESITTKQFFEYKQSRITVKVLHKYTGLLFSEAEAIMGINKVKAAEIPVEKKEAVKKNSKIWCERGGAGRYVSKSACLPGCNDACRTCNYAKAVGVKTISNVGNEEYREMTIVGEYGGVAASVG